MLTVLVLLVSLVSARPDGHGACLDSTEARRAVYMLEDRLLLLESDSLCRLRHTEDSAALTASDSVISKTKQALDVCLLSLHQTDSLRRRNAVNMQQDHGSVRAYGFGFLSGAATTATLILMWVLR